MTDSNPFQDILNTPQRRHASARQAFRNAQISPGLSPRRRTPFTPSPSQLQAPAAARVLFPVEHSGRGGSASSRSNTNDVFGCSPPLTSTPNVSNNSEHLTLSNRNNRRVPLPTPPSTQQTRSQVRNATPGPSRISHLPTPNSVQTRTRHPTSALLSLNSSLSYPHNTLNAAASPTRHQSSVPPLTPQSSERTNGFRSRTPELDNSALKTPASCTSRPIQAIQPRSPQTPPHPRLTIRLPVRNPPRILQPHSPQALPRLMIPPRVPVQSRPHILQPRLPQALPRLVIPPRLPVQNPPHILQPQLQAHAVPRLIITRRPPIQDPPHILQPRLPQALPEFNIPPPPPLQNPPQNIQPRLPAPIPMPPQAPLAAPRPAVGHRNQAADLFCKARRPYIDPPQRHDLGPMNIECQSCHALHWSSERLSNSSNANPKFGLCCNQGNVVVPLLENPPEPLSTLYTSDSNAAKRFRELIWKYNRAFSFTSLGVDEDHAVNGRGRGPPIYRISGELCHRSGALATREGHTPRYAQLYIYEPRAALDARMQQNGDLDRNTMESLQALLHQHHQYTPVYKHAYEVLCNYDPAEDVCIRLRVAPGNDRRRYNLPTADEVAVILPGDNSTEARDIILRHRDGPLYRVSDLHPAYAPLQYPLLFPYGENGWHPALKQRVTEGNNKVQSLSQTRYCAFRLQVRRDEFSTILRAGRLTQRYVVDSFASADQNRLRFITNNQSKLRASLYSGLEDAVAHADGADGEIDLGELGQRVILPSSYIGGPRNMHQRFQDSMAIARYFRRVDAFITVTTNPRWVEIERELLPGQTAYDRPDLVARAFQLKKKAILEDIYKHGIYGHTVAYVYTIEFQKRGLPHMHCLIFFKEPYKLLTPAAIDECIWARWPDPVTQPLLFETVKRCMVHGPCGPLNPRAPCMENGRCTKGFPKDFQDFTSMDNHGYPLYYRPDDGRAYQIGDFMVDNRWIVPYPPYLCSLYDCHINFECAVSLGAFKYAFKYIQKGPDRATLEVNQRNEVKRWIDGRYISPPEAVWRIFHFDTHEAIPNIVRLQVHLPGQHMVTFDPDDDPAVIRDRAAAERTTLTAFFAANADNGELGNEARRWTYQEFPHHFVYKEAVKRWSVRQRGFALGRMYFVKPTAGERFYLRTLLSVVKGPKSFEDLRSYNGVIHPSFHAACLARGLLEDDGEWQQCLEEAAEMQTGTQLRQLFATLLLFCEPSQPDVLWNNFRRYICDDLRRRLLSTGYNNPSEDDIFDYGLYLLEKLLNESGTSLANFPSMPQPTGDWDHQVVNPLINEQLNYDRNAEKAELDRRLQLLNPDQLDAYSRIIESVQGNHGQKFFLNGPGGTGKTFVYNTICNKIRSEGWVVLCVASSGIAALLMRGGRTAHSMFKIPVEGLTEDSMCAIPKESLRAALIRVVKLIIWDEVGAQHRLALEALDRTAKDIRNDERPFGGITTVMGGDFQQTLPVVPKGSKEDILDATVQRSQLWNDIEILCLRQNMRLDANDPHSQQFAQWLLDIGHGRNMEPDSKVRFSDDMRVPNTLSLIRFIYPNVESNPPPPPDYFLDRMILAPRNSDVQDVNDEILDRMAGERRIYVSADEVIHEAGADGPAPEHPIPVEFLRSLNVASLPPGELTVKVGCPLILLRNLSPSQGLCNGTRMVVSRMSDRVLEARILGGEHDGEIALIPRISLIPTTTTGLAVKFKRRQFPVRLAFALTINKSQGQSVKYVGLDLRFPVFAHGQLYVALSRATSNSRVKILLPDDAVESITANVVYPEVLIN